MSYCVASLVTKPKGENVNTDEILKKIRSAILDSRDDLVREHFVALDTALSAGESIPSEWDWADNETETNAAIAAHELTLLDS